MKANQSKKEQKKQWQNQWSSGNKGSKECREEQERRNNSHQEENIANRTKPDITCYGKCDSSRKERERNYRSCDHKI